MARRLSLVAATLLLGAATLPVRAAENPSFVLFNHGRTAVRELFVTPAGDGNWGRNRLDGRSLPAGQSFEVRRRTDGNCIMDIRAVFADGRTEDRRGVNTCAIDAVEVGATPVAGTPPTKSSDDPSFRLVNRGPQAIAELYATPAGRTNWGQNRLDAGAVAPQTEKLVHITKTGDCLFDLRVVFADHTAKEKHRTDLCKLTDLPVP